MLAQQGLTFVGKDAGRQLLALPVSTRRNEAVGGTDGEGFGQVHQPERGILPLRETRIGPAGQKDVGIAARHQFGVGRGLRDRTTRERPRL